MWELEQQHGCIISAELEASAKHAQRISTPARSLGQAIKPLSPSAQVGKAICAHAAARKRPAHADEILQVATNAQQAPCIVWKRPKQDTPQPVNIWVAALKAQQDHKRAWHVSAATQQRSQGTGASLPMAQSAPGSHISPTAMEQCFIQAALKVFPLYPQIRFMCAYLRPADHVQG